MAERDGFAVFYVVDPLQRYRGLALDISKQYANEFHAAMMMQVEPPAPLRVVH